MYPITTGRSTRLPSSVSAAASTLLARGWFRRRCRAGSGTLLRKRRVPCGRGPPLVASDGGDPKGTGASASPTAPAGRPLPHLARHVPPGGGRGRSAGVERPGLRGPRCPDRARARRAPGHRLGARGARRVSRAPSGQAGHRLFVARRVRALVGRLPRASTAAVAAGWMARSRARWVPHPHAVRPARPGVGARLHRRSGRTSVRRSSVDPGAPAGPGQPDSVMVPVIWTGWTSQWK